MKNKNLNKIIRVIAATLKRYGIKRAGIFGSYVRGENKENSDIDILIEIPKKIKFGLLDLVGLKLDLQDALRRKVDLVEYKMIRPELKERILGEEVRII